jgi:hypothetical protein
MIPSRTNPRAKAIAEVLAIIADAHPELSPDHPHSVRETDDKGRVGEHYRILRCPGPVFEAREANEREALSWRSLVETVLEQWLKENGFLK